MLFPEYRYFAVGGLNQLIALRNTLLVLRSKRTALDENGNKVPAIQWLAEVLFAPKRPISLKPS